MRQLLLLPLLVLGSLVLSAQEASIVVLNATTDPVEYTNDLQLREELQGIFDKTLGAYAYGSLGCEFVLEATSSQRISGMAKRTVARYTFTLTFLDYVLDIPVGAPVMGLVSGSGDNAALAASNALSKLRKTHFSSDRLMEVIADHREALPACEDLISRLKALNQQGESTAVLAVYAQLADAGDCTDKLAALVEEVYQQQQAADCRQLIIRAKAEVVAGNMTRAARLLAGVDPTMECADEVEALLDELMKRETLRVKMNWYNSAYRNRTLSPASRRRVISNLVLEYAYQRY